MSLRTAVIARWIAVAEDLKELNNISDVYAIVKGVEHKSVKRLAKTWKNVPKKTLKSLEQFKAMLEPVVLRHSLSSLPLPYLPPLRKSKYTLNIQNTLKLQNTHSTFKIHTQPSKL